MNYLLDTHVLIDLLTDPQRVGRAVRSALEAAGVELAAF